MARASALAFAALVFASVPAAATVMVEVAFEDLATRADAIVHGRVVHTGVQMEIRSDSYDPTTITTLEVAEWMKGEGDPSLRIRHLGGVHINGGMWIDGTPRYEVGDEVIVFLQTDPEVPEYFRTLALEQGRFNVLHGVPGTPTVVARDTRALAFARTDDTTTEWRGQGGVSGGEPQMIIEPGERIVVTLAEFRARLEALLGDDR